MKKETNTTLKGFGILISIIFFMISYFYLFITYVYPIFFKDIIIYSEKIIISGLLHSVICVCLLLLYMISDIIGNIYKDYIDECKYEYDKNGNKIKEIDSSGNIHRYEYDENKINKKKG